MRACSTGGARYAQGLQAKLLNWSQAPLGYPLGQGDFGSALRGAMPKNECAGAEMSERGFSLSYAAYKGDPRSSPFAQKVGVMPKTAAKQ